jgi:hypothetical protein
VSLVSPPIQSVHGSSHTGMEHSPVDASRLKHASVHLVGGGGGLRGGGGGALVLGDVPEGPQSLDNGASTGYPGHSHSQGGQSSP